MVSGKGIIGLKYLGKDDIEQIVETAFSMRDIFVFIKRRFFKCNGEALDVRLNPRCEVWHCPSVIKSRALHKSIC